MVEITREQALSAKCQTYAVPAPEWMPDGETYVRALATRDYPKLLEIIGEDGETSLSDEDALFEINELCLCDSKGAPLFTKADREQLGAVPLVVLLRCMNKALEVNGVAESAEGNSEASPGG